jgi:hypothetical protein
MKIEIDTSRDSKEEIKKLIKMLQAIVEEGSGWGTPSYNPSEMPGLGFMDAGSSTSSNEIKPETKKDDDDKIPEIELY